MSMFHEVIAPSLLAAAVTVPIFTTYAFLFPYMPDSIRLLMWMAIYIGSAVLGMKVAYMYIERYERKAKNGSKKTD